MSCRWLSVAVCLLCAPAGARGDDAPLATALAVRRLRHDEAAAKRPVRITGVVTHVEPGQGDFFVQDGTAGVYVHPVAGPPPVGARVLVSGVSDAGSFAPCVTAVGPVVVLGPGVLPDPEPYDLVLDDSRWLDARYVAVRARVTAARQDSGHALLSVATVRGTGRVRVPGVRPAGELARLVGRCVRVRGVVVPGFDDRRGVDRPPTILAAALPAAEPGDDAEPDDVASLAELGWFSPEPGPVGRRVVVRGTVGATARSAAGETLVFIQDATAGAKVVLASDPHLAPGDRVEVTGTLVVRRTRLICGTRRSRPTRRPRRPPNPRPGRAPPDSRPAGTTPGCARSTPPCWTPGSSARTWPRSTARTGRSGSTCCSPGRAAGRGSTPCTRATGSD